MNVPDTLKYTESHEWLKLDGNEAAVGITDHAQSELSDVVYVELPKTGREVKAGDTVAVVESVKAASDIYAPVAGTITAVNEALAADPALINTSPFGEGWIFKMTVSEPREIDSLKDAKAYTTHIGGK